MSLTRIMAPFSAQEILGAIDLGGTKILSVLFSGDGSILGPPVETPTLADSSPEVLVDRIARNFRNTLRSCGRQAGQVSRLGIGVPTTVQYNKGLIDPSPNLPTLTDYPLARELTARLGIPAALEKDANCFILGEMAFGAAVGSGNCCGVTIGTGLGVGIVIGGRLLRGSHWCAGEIWTCPYRDGILEDWASGTALENRYFQKTGGRLSGNGIHQRAREGDPLALALLAELGEVLGFGLSYLVNGLNPEMVVVGGSVAEAWDYFSGPMQEVIDRHRVKRNASRIVRSKLGKLASLYGVAFMEGG
ncbi:MAG: ROK family protein [Candidatus Glassbacteria bacterium]